LKAKQQFEKAILAQRSIERKKEEGEGEEGEGKKEWKEEMEACF